MLRTHQFITSTVEFHQGQAGSLGTLKPSNAHPDIGVRSLDRTVLLLSSGFNRTQNSVHTLNCFPLLHTPVTPTFRLPPAEPDRQDGSTDAMSVSQFSLLFRLQGGRDSSVGVATRYCGTTRFSSPVQTGPGPHPACCAMGTGSKVAKWWR